MISKNDIILLLTEMQSKGIDVDKELNMTISSQSISLNVLKKINDYKTLDIVNFYNKLRRAYNGKKSKLYINIMKSDENILNNSPQTIVTTLTGLLNQILQYSPEDKTMFYTHMRCDEIVRVLDIYFKTYDLEPAIKLLTLFKSDQKALESISR